MRLVKRFCVLIPGLAMALAMSSVVRADAVTDWNATAIQIIARATTHPGATSFLAWIIHDFASEKRKGALKD